MIHIFLQLKDPIRSLELIVKTPGDETDLNTGDYVSLKGEYVGGDTISVTQIHVPSGRQLKRVV